MKSYLPALCLLCLCAATCAQEPPASPQSLSAIKPATDGRVWGALIFATNDTAQLTGAREQTPAHLPKLNERLAKVFHFKHFEILGQHQQDIFREYESWVVPSRDLFMKIDSKGPADKNGVNLHLQVWREQQVLVKSDAVLRAGSPLFIGGPPWKDGRLIFVLSLDRK
ncbi:MAG: hypothetical protein ACKVY0_17285 [Prosthecobacter sp.]|uniref:hypothetical protein n=1 Tax=Prosthecobacter sp. TaxID=1965333 RepID=UPI0038FED7FB